MYIDTHAHVYLGKFAPDYEAVLDRAAAAGVRTILMPAIDAASAEQALGLCGVHRGVTLRAMAALHPSETRDATEADMQRIAALCRDPRVVAVGESGLDYYWDRSFTDEQHRFLRAHIALAVETGLPLVLHNRDASDDLIRIVGEASAATGGRLTGVFHCFGGDLETARRILDLGFYLGIGGTVTFKNAGVDRVVAELPLERLLLETDAPYLAPAPHRGKRNEPAYIPLIAQRIAEAQGVEVEQVARVTSRNARALFRLPEAA